MFTKETIINSQAQPGVTYTVTHSTERRRRALRALVAEAQGKLRKLMVRAVRFEDEAADLAKTGGKPSDEDAEAYAALRQAMNELQVDEINPAWVRWCISRLSGIEGDNAPGDDLSLDTILDLPTPLYEEMLGYARAEVTQVPEALKNLPSPSTSTAAVAGEALPTTATTAANSAGS